MSIGIINWMKLFPPIKLRHHLKRSLFSLESDGQHRLHCQEGAQVEFERPRKLTRCPESITSATIRRQAKKIPLPPLKGGPSVDSEAGVASYSADIISGNTANILPRDLYSPGYCPPGYPPRDHPPVKGGQSGLDHFFCLKQHAGFVVGLPVACVSV